MWFREIAEWIVKQAAVGDCACERFAVVLFLSGLVCVHRRIGAPEGVGDVNGFAVDDEALRGQGVEVRIVVDFDDDCCRNLAEARIGEVFGCEPARVDMSVADHQRGEEGQAQSRISGSHVVGHRSADEAGDERGDVGLNMFDASNPSFVIPAKAGIQRPMSSLGRWTPAFAGVTK